jgi:hypothetical protein
VARPEARVLTRAGLLPRAVRLGACVRCARAQESRSEMHKAKGSDYELAAMLGGSFMAMLAVQWALHEMSE